MKNSKVILAAAALLLTASGARAFGGFGAMGKNFSRAAAQAGAQRLAVLPFSPLDDSDSREGQLIAEQLTYDISRRGRVRLVERALLSAVFGEHRMGFSGALDEKSLARLGRLLQARAVVTGTFITSGNRVEVYARLIDIETGAILAAHKTESRRSVFPALRKAVPEPEHLDPLEAIMEVKLFQMGYEKPAAAHALGRGGVAALPGLARTALRENPAAEAGLRDSLGEDPCAGAVSRVNSLEAADMHLKVRYWAEQIRRHKLSAAETRRKLEAGLPDRRLKARFAEALNQAVLYGSAPLSPAEVKSFVAADSESFILRLRCLKGAAGGGYDR